MRRLRTCHLRNFVTFVLAMSVSVCCCQAHFLLHGFVSGGELAAASPPTAGCCVDSCADDAPDEGRPAAPEKTCQSCCVKGTGLKDGIVLPSADLAGVLAFIAETPIDLDTQFAHVRSHAAPAPPFVAAPTLLRLRCALIV